MDHGGAVRPRRRAVPAVRILPVLDREVVPFTYPGKYPLTTDGPNTRAGFIPALVNDKAASWPTKTERPMATGARKVLFQLGWSGCLVRFAIRAPDDGVRRGLPSMLLDQEH